MSVMIGALSGISPPDSMARVGARVPTLKGSNEMAVGATHGGKSAPWSDLERVECNNLGPDIPLVVFDPILFQQRAQFVLEALLLVVLLLIRYVPLERLDARFTYRERSIAALPIEIAVDLAPAL